MDFLDKVIAHVEEAKEKISPAKSKEAESHAMPACGETPPDNAQIQEEAAEDVFNPFSEPSVKRGFLRKVFLTSMVQLMVTFGIICPFVFWEEARTWVAHTSWFTYGMLALLPLLIVALAFFQEKLLKRFPWNLLFLVIFSMAEGLMFGSVCASFDADPILWGVGASALLCFTLALFTLQSKLDLNWRIGTLWVICWSLPSFGILFAFPFKPLHIGLACLGTILFTVYIVVDLLPMLKEDLTPEDYIFAALKLYLDGLLRLLKLLKKVLKEKEKLEEED